jgi:hypothetical protein
MDEHFVVVQYLGNMGFSRLRYFTSRLEFGPCTVLQIVLIQVVKTVVLARPAAAKHYDVVVNFYK